MYIADMLSRAYLPDSASPGDHDFEQVNMASFLPIADQRLEEIRRETENDKALQKLKTIILHGWPDHKNSLPPEVCSYFSMRDELTVQDGLIFRGERVVIPTSLRLDMKQKVHSSHMGIDSCLRRAREHIYWPGMSADIKQQIEACDTCGKFGSSQQKEPLMPHEVPSRPWEKVATDIFEHDSKEYLITVDYYSNFWEFDRLPDTRASSVILKLKNHFARHGCPDQLVSDNGPQFSSAKFEQFAQAWEFEHCTSSPGNSKANGKAESAVKTAKRILRKALDAGTDPYVAILDYRNTPTQGMESSPAQRLMNRRTKTLLPTKKTLLQPRVVQHDREKKQLIKRQEQQTQYYNRGVKELQPLSEGDIVRMKPFRLGDKNWQKAIVTERLDQRSYTVETPDGGTYRRNRYHLRKRKEPPPVQELPDMDQPPVELQPSTTSQAPSPGRREPEPTKLLPSKTSADKTAPSSDHAPREQRPTRTRRAPAHLADYVQY